MNDTSKSLNIEFIRKSKNSILSVVESVGNG